MLRVWGSMLGCGWRCREVLGEVWESVLGCGGNEKIWGSVGKCVAVWEGKGEMRGEV